MSNDELFVIIENDVDYKNIYGIYTNCIEAEDEVYNIIKYKKPNGIIRIYIVLKDKYYNDIEAECNIFGEYNK